MGTASYEKKGNVHMDVELGPSLPYHKCVAKIVCRFASESSRIIDIGCGVGQTAKEISRINPAIKLDIADSYEICLDRTRERAGNVRESFLMDEVSFNVNEVLDGGYDIIILSHVLEHLIFPAEAIEQLLGLLKPGGKLIVAVPNPARPTVMLTNLLKIHYVNRGHVHAWDRSHFMNFLEAIMGLKVTEYATDFIQLPFASRIAPFRAFGVLLAKLLPWWGFSNIAVIENTSIGESLYKSWMKKRSSASADDLKEAALT